MFRIGVIGDLHIKNFLGYSDCVPDKRTPEVDSVLQQIIDTFKEHDLIVLLGDNLNQRLNSAYAEKVFVRFIESFESKKLVILSGNHERLGDGTTALDFLKELKKDWKICTSWPEYERIQNGQHDIRLSFVPYMTRLDTGCETDQEAAQAIVNRLQPQSDVVFAHHAISHDTLNGQLVDLFNEPVLSSDELFKKTDTVVIGHIHDKELSSKNGHTFLRAGSIFNDIVNETEKSIWTIQFDDNNHKEIIEHRLKQRGIHKLINPSIEKVLSIDPYSIVKVIVTDRTVDLPGIKEALKRIDGSVLVESYESDREQIHGTIDEVKDYSVEEMLKMYAKAKQIDPELLIRGYELIKD